MERENEREREIKREREREREREQWRVRASSGGGGRGGGVEYFITCAQLMHEHTFFSRITIVYAHVHALCMMLEYRYPHTRWNQPLSLDFQVVFAFRSEPASMCVIDAR